jgi:acetyltransferase EpsM
MKKRLIVVGAHGSGDIAMTVFEDINSVKEEWEIVGFINDIVKPGSYMGKYKVVGNSEQILDYVNQGYYIHYTYHLNVKLKKERVQSLINLNIPIEAHATGIHPLAYINPTSIIGQGCLVLPNVATSTNAVIKNFVHLYTNSFIGHDTTIMDYSTIAAHSVLGARIVVQEGAHIGLNCVIREDLVIGKYSILGIGSVVTKDVGEAKTVVGNPAKAI